MSLHRLALAAALGLAALPLLTAAAVEKIDVFVAGQDSYNTYRIPAIVRAKSGALLAFCEGRKSGGGDAGDIDIVLKRSVDGGRTWSGQQVLWNDGTNTCGNPCPVVDDSTGTVWLVLTHNVGSEAESAIIRKETKRGN